MDYYESEITSYAKDLTRDLNQYIIYKENPEYYEQQYSYDDLQKYTPDYEKNLISKIKEKLSLWKYVYMENMAVMELGIAYSEFINDLGEKQYYHNELIKIRQYHKEKEQRLNTTKENLSTIYKNKVLRLEKQNKIYIRCFLFITGVFILSLIGWLIKGILPNDSQLMAFILTKAIISMTISVSIFWIAKFFNRRIHENVHLIEMYEHRALLLDTFDLLTQSVNTKEHEKEILDKILTVLINDPTECLNKKKIDKLPTSEIAELIKAMQPFSQYPIQEKLK